MTKEARIVFGLNDLVSVRQRFDGRHWRLPTSCPLCLARWDERDSRRTELDELLLMMRNLADRNEVVEEALRMSQGA